MAALRGATVVRSISSLTPTLSNLATGNTYLSWWFHDSRESLQGTL